MFLLFLVLSLTDEEVSLLWSLVVNHVKSLLETSDVALKQDRQNALEALLDTLRVTTEAEIFSPEQNLVSLFLLLLRNAVTETCTHSCSFFKTQLDALTTSFIGSQSLVIHNHN